MVATKPFQLTSGHIYTPIFEVKVKGQTLDPKLAKSIMQVSVTKLLNTSSSFSFQLNDPTLEFIDQKQGLFVEGNAVEVYLGYVGSLHQMLVGEISAVTASFPSSGPATLGIEGFDHLHRATRGTTYRKFEASQSDRDIITEIIQQDLKLKVSLDKSIKGKGKRIQNNTSTIRFLEQLAKANGCTFWVEGDTFYMHQRTDTISMSLTWGKTLLSFSPRLSTAGQVQTVGVQCWDHARKQAIVAQANLPPKTMVFLAKPGQQQLKQGAGGRSQRMIVCNQGVSNPQEAQTLAAGTLDEQQQNLLTGYGTSVGHPGIQPGILLQLNGIGRFSGPYEVVQATHTVGSSGYQTSFQVRQQR
jgi:hypothetical protein